MYAVFEVVRSVTTRRSSDLPDVKIGLADPFGAALYEYYAHGTLKAEGSSISEGIGQGRITENIKDMRIDFPYQIPDEEGVRTCLDRKSTRLNSSHVSISYAV